MRTNKDMEDMCMREDSWDGWGGVARVAGVAGVAGLSLSLLVGAIGKIEWMHVRTTSRAHEPIRRDVKREVPDEATGAVKPQSG